jgi:hypothetical protein
MRLAASRTAQTAVKLLYAAVQPEAQKLIGNVESAIFGAVDQILAHESLSGSLNVGRGAQAGDAHEVGTERLIIAFFGGDSAEEDLLVGRERIPQGRIGKRFAFEAVSQAEPVRSNR